MTLATTTRLVALREPVPLAKTLAALDVLSGGRLAEDELALEDVDGPDSPEQAGPGSRNSVRVLPA